MRGMWPRVGHLPAHGRYPAKGRTVATGHQRSERPQDLITLKEAAKLTGKAEHSLRRWKREKGLKDWRDTKDARAPSLVSRAEVTAIAVQVASTAVVDTTRKGTGGQVSAQAVATVLREHLHTLERDVEDLRVQRDATARRLVDREAELAMVRAELVDTRKRVDALERELNGGVRGLLVRALRR